jgi:uncharacterized membrane protein
MMDERTDWTRQLGKAFSTNREGVFESIQRLRDEARDLGNLKSTEQQKVVVETTDSGQQVIVIEPANPQVIYVPQYDPKVVYTQPATTVVADDSSDEIAAGVIGFTAGIIVGVAIDDDDDWCGGWGWHGGCCYEEAWEDFYDHRENMANDWYEHREEMAGIRDENRGERQERRGERQGERADTRDQRQGDRQATRDQRQTQRQTGEAARQQRRQPSTATTSSRGRVQSTGQRPTTRSGGGPGAFQGYQSGSQTRAASSRGRGSMSGSRGGGGGGGRGGGGRRR